MVTGRSTVLAGLALAAALLLAGACGAQPGSSRTPASPTAGAAAAPSSADPVAVQVADVDGTLAEVDGELASMDAALQSAQGDGG
jgi:hypothetical protein